MISSMLPVSFGHLFDGRALQVGPDSPPMIASGDVRKVALLPANR